ncbi:MAG: FAD-dependent oxidoreductase [Clostridia bacterium]|nr:FAD-dependent oxidoreductase [Clostridia bacterium]
MADLNRFYDVIVVGGGPAGLTAAIYLARARYRVLVVEKDHFGGQITITAEVVNYPGVPKCSGVELTTSMRNQAESFGAEFLLAEVESLALDGDIKRVKTSRGELSCFGVLIATGAQPRMVGFTGEQEHKGRGVAYCATCDGEFFTGKDIFVVGGGFAAAEESVFLTKFARHVTILVRGEDFTCAEATAEHAKNHDKISVLYNTSVEEVSGDDGLSYIRYRNAKSGEITEFTAKDGETFGVFVFAGYEPATSLIQGIAELNEQGYVITDRSQKTSVDGLYAAGDVCVKPLRQVVTAVGEGALAATELERYAAAMQTKTGRIPKRPQTEKQAAATVAPASAGGLFDEAMLSQLNAVFSRMESPLTLKLYLDEREVSLELKTYMTALAELTDKLRVELSEEIIEDMPCVRIYRQDGSYSGLAFHGVPGGHEFTSFVLGLYNAAGNGQAVDAEAAGEIAAIEGRIELKALVSLSCTMCPELVIAAQKIASMNDKVSAEVYDLNHFPLLREKYKVMSVPCLVINDMDVSFGKKNIAQVLERIKKIS